MHSFTMPEEYVARTIARQGREHTVETVHGPSTALLVVDMQNYFVTPPYQAACPVAQTIVPNINRIARTLRAAGGKVVWIQNHAPLSKDKEWSTQRERYLPEAGRARWEALQHDAHGFQLWPEMEVCESDERVVKVRYSPFSPGSSDIHKFLEETGVDTVIITGVATNACCESTARDAMMLNFRSLMVSDACAAASQDEHASSLSNFYLYFGDVQTSSEVVKRIAS